MLKNHLLGVCGFFVLFFGLLLYMSVFLVVEKLMWLLPRGCLAHLLPCWGSGLWVHLSPFFRSSACYQERQLCDTLKRNGCCPLGSLNYDLCLYMVVFPCWPCSRQTGLLLNTLLSLTNCNRGIEAKHQGCLQEEALVCT